MKLIDLVDAIALYKLVKGAAQEANPGDAVPINWPFRAFGRRLRLRGMVEVEK